MKNNCGSVAEKLILSTWYMAKKKSIKEWFMIFKISELSDSFNFNTTLNLIINSSLYI